MPFSFLLFLSFSLRVKFKISYIHNICTLVPSGNLLSMYDAREMTDAVNEQINTGKCWILINLEDVPYMSSEGLNVLLKILTASRNHGGDTVLYSLNKQLEELFLITRLAHIFAIFPDENSARKKIESENSLSNSDKPTQTV